MKNVLYTNTYVRNKKTFLPVFLAPEFKVCYNAGKVFSITLIKREQERNAIPWNYPIRVPEAKKPM